MATLSRDLDPGKIRIETLIILIIGLVDSRMVNLEVVC